MRLLIAASGGHLTELFLLAPRLRPIDDDVVWITSRTSQSQSLLDKERVHYVRAVAPRDWRSVLANCRVANRVLRDPVTSV